MSRHLFQRWSQSLSRLWSGTPASKSHRPARTPQVEALEERWAPVVGAFAIPNPVTAGTGYDGVVQLTMNTQPQSSTCSGSLLYTGRHILTAAHCLTNDDGQINSDSTRVMFQLPGRTVNLTVPRSNYVVHPDYRGWTSPYDNDIAILRLGELAPSGPRGLGAERYQLYRLMQEVQGDVATFVGYGRTGTGMTGQVDGTSGTKRLGQNRFERSLGYNSAILQTDFDSGQAANDLFGRRYGINHLGFGANEALTAKGDSGGPGFLNGLIASVTSYTGSFDGPEDVLPGINSSFGDYGGYTRVSRHAAWIDSMIAGRYSLILDMNNQRAGNDGTRDTIVLTTVGSRLDVWVNDAVIHSEQLSNLGSIVVYGSGDGDSFTLSGDVGFHAIVDGRGGLDTVTVRTHGSWSGTYNVTDTSIVQESAAPNMAVTYLNMEDAYVAANAGNIVNVYATAATTPVTILDADAVNVGPLGSMANILSQVSVLSPYVATWVQLNDSANPVMNRTVTVESGRVLGLVSARMLVQENRIRALTVRTGTENATYNVFGTPAPTTLVGRSGADTFNVARKSHQLTILAGQGSDLINLGTAAQGTAELLGAVIIMGQGGNDRVVYNNAADTTGRLYLVSPGVLSVEDRLMEVRYTDVGEFTMLAGSGEDTLAPYGGTLGTRTTFNGGVGQNMVLRYSEDGYALWTITGADAGSLSFPGYGTVDFTACGNLWGGMANDLFLFQEGGSISGFVDGGGGTHNMLDYSGKQGGVYVLMPYGAASYVGWFQNIQDAAGGQGNNLLVGDHHDNQLYGNDGRDVLIGNWGSDSLAGGPGEDLVIGGVTDYDYDPYALFVIAEVWSWNYDYATRIYLLTAGFEGIPVLNTDTVHDDYAVNELAGNGGLDWFFASYADVIQDLEPSERVDYVY